MRRSISSLAAVLALFVPAAAHAAPSGFSSGLDGCSASCIRSATVVPFPNRAKFVVKTHTPARIQVVVRTPEVAGFAGGGLTTGAIVASRSSGRRFRTAFGTLVRGLQPDTAYAISVAATDSQGRKTVRSGTFRTPHVQTIGAAAGAGTLASDAGCAAQCIRTAEATAGVRSAVVRVHTNTPAKLQISPGGGAPSIAIPEYRTDTRVTLIGLKSGRSYDVTVRAIDAHGAISVRTGVIKMRTIKARVLVYEIDVSKAGEKWKINKGELAFFGSVDARWSAPPAHAALLWQLERPEGKVKSGSEVHFPNQGEVIVEDVGDSLSVRVQGVERDRKGSCFDSLPDGPYEAISGKLEAACMAKTWSTAIKSYSAESLVKEIPGPQGPMQVIRWVDERVEAQSRGSNVQFKADVRIEPWVE